MSFGFSATNGSNQFIVTDEFANLHFLGNPVVNNNLVEVTASNFILDRASTGCEVIPTVPYPANGKNGSWTGAPADGITRPDQSTAVLWDGDFDGVNDGDGNWAGNPGTVSTVSAWVDLGCNAVVTQIVLRIKNYGSFFAGSGSTLNILYSDTTNVVGSMSIDQAIATQSGDPRIDFSDLDNLLYTIDIDTSLGHRYWAIEMVTGNATFTRTEIYEVQLIFAPVGGVITEEAPVDPRTLHTYSITSTEPPLIFIKPTDTARWHALIGQDNVGDVWTLKVLVSGANDINAPEIYAFVPPSAIATPTETHGLLVQDASSNATFDSRLRPLAIIDGGLGDTLTNPANGGTPISLAYIGGETVTPGTSGSLGGTNVVSGASTIPLVDASSLPNSGTLLLRGYLHGNGPEEIIGDLENEISWTGKSGNTLTGVTGVTSNFLGDYDAFYGSDYASIGSYVRYFPYLSPPTPDDDPGFDFQSGNSSTFVSEDLTTTVTKSNLMFAAPSLGQSVQSVWQQSYLDYIRSTTTGSITSRTQIYSNSIWWVLYRNAFRLSGSAANKKLDLGWNAWLAGLLHTESVQSSSWRGGGATNGSGGEAPYLDVTINTDANAYLIADASKYQ